MRKRIALWWHSIEVTQGVHAGRRRYTPGSGKALAVVLAMRGGMADNIRRRMHWTDRLALNVVGGLVLPLTVAGEEQKVRSAILSLGFNIAHSCHHSTWMPIMQSCKCCRNRCVVIDVAVYLHGAPCSQ